MAVAKIVGLVVTPTTLNSSASCFRLPVRMRSRERSSSQTATPAPESSARFLFCAMAGAFRAEWIRTAPASAVAGGVGEAAGLRDGAGRHRVAGGGRRDALAGGRDDG